jgi:AbiV family abortive infection protein
LAALAQASVDNAGALLDDAGFLLDAGRAPRAHALAILALEEIGKAHLCLIALIPMPEPFYGTKGGDFWAAWRSHSDKLTWALAFLGALVRKPERSAAEEIVQSMAKARDGDRRKQDGLYVDYRGGAILAPDQIGVPEAQAVVAVASELFDVAALSVGAVATAAAENLDNVRDMLAPFWDGVAAGTVDLEEALNAVGEVFRDQYAGSSAAETLKP